MCLTLKSGFEWSPPKFYNLFHLLLQVLQSGLLLPKIATMFQQRSFSLVSQAYPLLLHRFLQIDRPLVNPSLMTEINFGQKDINPERTGNVNLVKMLLICPSSGVMLADSEINSRTLQINYIVTTQQVDRVTM